MAAESLYLLAPHFQGLPIGPDRTNWVNNPSFENDLAGWTFSANAEWGGTAAAYRAGPLSKYAESSGSFSVLLTGTKSANANYAVMDLTGSAIPVTPGSTYTARAGAISHGDPPASPCGTLILIRWFDGADAYISQELSTYFAGAGQGSKSVTGVAPAGAATAKVVLYVDSQTANDQVAVYLDSISFEKASSIPDYFDGDTLGYGWWGGRGNSVSSTAPQLSLTDQTVWKIEDFDLDNPVPRDVFVADVDRDGSRPMMEPRWENRQPSFALRMTPQATANNMLQKITDLERFLSAARRVAKDAPVDPANYVRLVWTPQDSTKTYFIPLYGGYIEGIDRTDTGWALRTPKITVQMTADPAGYGTWKTFLAQTNLNANFVSPMAVPAVAGDLPPWAKVTIADAAGVDRGLVRIGVRQNDNGTFFQVNSSAINVTGYDSSYTGGFVQFNTWTDGRYRAVGAIPSQTATGKFRVYALACRGVPGLKLRFSYATKNGSRRRLDAVDIGTGANSGDYYEDFFLGEVNADHAWDSWLETNGLAGLVWGIVFLPVDSFVEVVGPGSGENLAGQSNSFDDFIAGPSSTHIASRTLNGGGGTWSTAGTNVGSPTWPVSNLLGGSNYYAARQNVSAAAPGFARAGTGSIIDGSFKTRVTILPTGVLNDGATFPVYGGLFARWANITNFIAAAFVRASDTTMKPCLAICLGGTYYSLWTGAAIPYSVTCDIELQLTSDGRWWVRYDEVETTNYSITASQQASGSHAALRAGAALGGATAGHGLFDWKIGSSGNIRLWHFYRQRALMGVTPLPLLANKNIAWNDAVLMVDNNAAEYPYAGASGIELRPGVANTLNLMVRRNAELNDPPGWTNDTSTNIKVEGYERFLTVPQ